jgi:putative hydrolase
MAAGLGVTDVLDLLIGATVAAMESVEWGQLAHCFSILPKIGLAESDLTDEHLGAWASAAARTGTLIEVNEKWGCPGPRSLSAALAAGAQLVASTDSHVSTDVGRYSKVSAILTATEES